MLAVALLAVALLPRAGGAVLASDPAATLFLAATGLTAVLAVGGAVIVGHLHRSRGTQEGDYSA